MHAYLSSQDTRASLVLTEDWISFEPKLDVFMVQNSDGYHHTVADKHSCKFVSSKEEYLVEKSKKPGRKKCSCTPYVNPATLLQLSQLVSFVIIIKEHCVEQNPVGNEEELDNTATNTEW